MTKNMEGRTAKKAVQGVAGNGGRGKEDPEKECVAQALRLSGILGVAPQDLGFIQATDGKWHTGYQAKILADLLFKNLLRPSFFNGRPS